MVRWEHIGSGEAPDGKQLTLRRRGAEYLIVAGGYDLMSSEDEGSSRALAELGCAHIDFDQKARVLVGGLGMGYTLRAALDVVGPRAVVVVAELVPIVVEWNRRVLGGLAKRPLDDPRCELRLGDVRRRIEEATSAKPYDAILLDVDNGPEFLAHRKNDALYNKRGLATAWNALRPGGVLGLWSFSDDRRFTERLERQGFSTKVERVSSRKGRGPYHVIWVARR